MDNSSNETKWLTTLLIFFLLAVIGCGSDKKAETSSTTVSDTARTEDGGINEEAAEIMREMSDYLTGLQQFSYKIDGMHEIVDTANNKIKETYKGEIYIKRPNKLRTNFSSENSNGSIFYDGSQFALMGKKVNMYAQTEAPPTLDQALDSAKYKLQLDPPGADLLYTDLYDGLMEETISGKVVGEETIDGTPTHHLSFEGKEVDWQIWIEKGDKPLPRKYMIVSKNVAENPVFSVEFSDWKTEQSPAFDEQLFVFTPPKDAQKIEFLDPEKLRKASNQKK